MHVIDFLLYRQSQPLLRQPAPQQEMIDTIIAIANQAPDHGRLHPTRYLIIENERLQELGELFEQALIIRRPQALTFECDKIREASLRAPLIITVIAKVIPHPTIPAVEQILSAGCSAHAILYGVEAYGYGAIWRTGPSAYDEHVKKGLGLTENEQIIGFIYIGSLGDQDLLNTPEKKPPVVQYWRGK